MDLDLVYRALLLRRYQHELFSDLSHRVMSSDSGTTAADCPFCDAPSAFSYASRKPTWECVCCGRVGDWVEYLVALSGAERQDVVELLEREAFGEGVRLSPSDSAAAENSQAPRSVSSLARVGAAALDGATITLLVVVALLLCEALADAQDEGRAKDRLLEAEFWLLFMVPFAYLSITHGIYGRTLGKSVFRLAVLGPAGTAPGIARAMLRSVVQLCLWPLLGLPWWPVLRGGQSLHDRVAGTDVLTWSYGAQGPLPGFAPTLTPPDGWETAKLSSRAWAFALDMLCSYLLFTLLALPSGASLSHPAFVFGTIAFYTAACHAAWGRTVGKSALGLRVVGTDGKYPTFGRSAIRTVVWALLFSYAMVLWPLLDGAGRGVHDYAAGTWVVHRSTATPPPQGGPLRAGQ